MSNNGLETLMCPQCGGEIEFDSNQEFGFCKYCGTNVQNTNFKKVKLQGKVQVDNSEFVEKFLSNARRARSKEDWEEVEKYYNLVEQNQPTNIEAVFFSSYGRVMLALFDTEYYKREQKIHVLVNSISIINENFEVTNEDKKTVIKEISSYLIKMYKSQYVRQVSQSYGVGSYSWQNNLFKQINNAFIEELQQIYAVHNDLDYIQELIQTHQKELKSGGCYVATCVYGSYDCPEVWTLRRYRDNELAKTWYGRAFIHIYYTISPKIVKLFGNQDWFKNMFKPRLDKMVNNLHIKGYEDTPYNDIKW